MRAAGPLGLEAVIFIAGGNSPSHNQPESADCSRQALRPDDRPVPDAGIATGSHLRGHFSCIVVGMPMADVFISYAREDMPFVRDLYAALTSQGNDAWVDWEGIIPTDQWRDEIRAAIEAAHTFVFVISPSSVASAMCMEELSCAVEMKRRLVPILLSAVADTLVPHALREVQWIVFQQNAPRDQPLKQLVDIIDKDLPWLRLDRRLDLRSREWQHRNRDTSLLLSGTELEEAQRWATQGATGARRPSELQLEFVAASAAAERYGRANTLAQQSRHYISTQQDLALLLGVEAIQLANTVSARSSLCAALQAHPYLDTWMRMPDEASVSALAFTSDGSLLAAGTVAGNINLWDVASRRLCLQLTPYQWPTALDRIHGIVDSVAFSPDGRMLAAAVGSSVVLWTVLTRIQVGPIQSTPYPITSMAFSPDGKLLAWGSTDRFIRLAKVGSIAFHPNAPVPFQGDILAGHAGRISALIFNPDGAILASSGEEKSIRLWDVPNKVQLAELQWHGDSIPGLAFNSSGTLLASGSFDGNAVLWDVASRQPAGKAMAHDSSGITAVAFDSSGKMLASSARNGSVALWDTESRNRIALLSGHDGRALRLAFSPAEPSLASGGTDAAAILWDVSTRSRLVREIPAHDERVCHVAFSQDGKMVATGAWDGRILLSGWSGANVPSRYLQHNQKIASFAFSPDGAVLASSTFGCLISLWNTATGEKICELQGHSGKVQSLAFASVGRLLATASWDGTVKLWDTAAWQAAGELKHAGEVFCVAISPDGKLLASGGKQTELYIWDLSTQQQVAGPLEAPSKAVTTVAFHPRLAILVTGSEDGMIQLWDTRSWQPRGRVLRSEAGIIYEVAFSPDGETLASAHSDGSVRLWDSASLTSIAELSPSRPTPIYCVSFSPDGRTLLAGACWDFAYERCSKGLVMAWDLSVDSWVSQARRMANRVLSTEERRSFVDKDWR